MLLNTCCGCISLQKGTIIIGSLSLISAVINAIVIGTNFGSMEVKKLEDDNHSSSNAAAIHITTMVVILKMFYVTILIYNIIGAIFSGLMIAGSVRNHSTYIFPWLAISFGGVVGAVCITLGVAIVIVSVVPVGQFFALLLFTTAATALQAYFWQVVYSHYKHVVAQKYGHETRPNDGKVLGGLQMNYHNV